MEKAKGKRGMMMLRIMFVGTFFLCMSQSMLINALPAILVDYGIGVGFGQLITTGYIFTLGLISACTAILVDRFSTKALFIFSLSSFIVGCVIACLAPDFPTLLLGRLLQAGGAGISLPLMQDVAFAVYPVEQYGRAMGAVGMVIGVAPAIGPAVAGPIIDLLGWRAMFVMLAAVTIVSLLLALFFVRDIGRHGKARFNALSAVLYIGGFVSLMAALTALELNEGGACALLLALLAAVLLIAYGRRDSSSAEPFLHVRCFLSRRFAIDTVLVVFAQSSMMIASVMVPLYVQGVQGDTATVSGLVIMPGAILMGILNPVMGRFYDRFGARLLSVVGCAFVFAGTVAFILCTATTPTWVVTVLYGVRIIGITMLWMPLVADATAALPAGEASQATAITTSMRQMFAAMLTTTFVSVMAANTVDASGISDYGFDVSFAALSALTLCMLALAAVFVGRRAHPRP